MSLIDLIIIYSYSYLPAIFLGAFFWWLDRFNRKSVYFLIFAFLWGAFGAGILSVFWNTFFHVALNAFQQGSADINDMITTVVVAPVVEELTKGLVILVFLKLSRIESVTDGILLGVVIGLGFAASENTYYATEVVYPYSGELAMWHNLWFREIHTTLLHASATAVWGAMIGYSRDCKGLRQALVLFIGFVLAAVTHGFWNFLASFVGTITSKVNLIQWAMRVELFFIFGMLLTLFLASMSRQRRMTFKELIRKHKLGIGIFVMIIAVTIGTYKIFIKGRVQTSTEYKAAVHFITNSSSLREYLLSDIEDSQFSDVSVTETEDYGVCRIHFSLGLKNKLQEEIEIGLVKVSDFWVVYEVILSPHMPSEYFLVSTYQKILSFLERLDFHDYRTAELYLDLIDKEVRDSRLRDYLLARVNALAGNSSYAFDLLEDVSARVNYSKLAVWLEQGMIEFERQKLPSAIGYFEKIVTEYDLQKIKDEKWQGESIFSGLPKDPFIATFNHDNILAEALKMLAATWRESGEFEKSLDYAERAIQKATEIGSSVVLSAAELTKAMSLFDFKKYEEADAIFQDVINDVENPNLTQKAWAWYYRAVIAGSFDRDEDSLDYFETAVNLDPYNVVFRKAAIGYLIQRNYLGDLEVALGFSLRGIDYEVDKNHFIEQASQIYLLLGMQDKTVNMQ